GSATNPCATTFDEAIITITGATETGFDLPDAWCAGESFDLSDYTALGGGEWTLATPGAGIIAGSVYLPAANFTGLVQIDYQPAAGGCGSPSTQFMQVYAPVSAALDPSPGVTFCLGSGNLPFDLTNYLNAGAT
ncbi:MAG TPA: hypothetical protein PK239_17345, partial [Chitinophagales bacterium]|nr:hypothetical protein [Chitinophagales bacterium]HRK29042.1 hypothetical protein [Chitinophagales bacterium]